jgi:hypothetical protein
LAVIDSPRKPCAYSLCNLNLSCRLLLYETNTVHPEQEQPMKARHHVTTFLPTKMNYNNFRIMKVKKA